MCFDRCGIWCFSNCQPPTCWRQFRSTMAFTARIRGVDISCDTLDDLEAILERFGAEQEPRDNRAGPPSGRPDAPARSNGEAPADADAMLLRAFLSGGDAGIPASTIQNLLPRAAGRGMPIALQRWAIRVNIANEDGPAACVPARPGGGRGWKLTQGAMNVAQLRKGAS